MAQNLRLSPESEARVRAFQENHGTLYTLRETAAIIGRSTRTVLRYVRDGTMEGTMLHRRWCFTEKAIKAYLDGKDGDMG